MKQATEEKEQLIARDEGFSQVCVWPGMMVGDEGGCTPEEFVSIMQDRFGVRVQYLEEVKTSPDLDGSGFPVEVTGGRNDLLFAVHGADIPGFAVPRLQVGIRWIEDVLAPCNGNEHIYPDRLSGYKGW